MLQVSMDGPSVDIKFAEALPKHRDECELPQLIDIGSCQLHVIHGAFQTGSNATPWR